MSSPAWSEGKRTAAEVLAALAELAERLGQCTNLDDVLTTSLKMLDTRFHLPHSMFLMLDETGSALYTIASHGYDRAGIGSEVPVGAGVIGAAASHRRPMRIGNLSIMIGYGRAIRESVDPDGVGTEIALPGLSAAASQLAAPSLVSNQLLGVLAVESEHLGAFTEVDESLLSVVAHVIASAIELDRVAGEADASPPGARNDQRTMRRGCDESAEHAVIRFFPVDGSTFLDGEYLIKGVAGRILWRLLNDNQADGRTEFTNREVRLDRSLDLPAYRDNLESRLVLLQRRLDERQAPVRIRKTGRGKFCLELEVASLTLELIDQQC